MKTLTNSKRLPSVILSALFYGIFQSSAQAALPASATASTDPAGHLPELIGDLTVVVLVGIVVVFVLAKIFRPQAKRPDKLRSTVNSSTPPPLPRTQPPPLPILQPPVLSGGQPPPFTT